MFQIYRYAAVILLVKEALSISAVHNNTTVNVPSRYTYNLPASYDNGTNGNGFVNTVVNNTAVEKLFQRASTSSFVAFDSEFYDIFGHNPALQLVAENKLSIFYEAGVWVYDHNEVWFSGSIRAGASGVFALNLDTFDVYSPNLSQTVTNANGGFYFNGLVYFCTDGNYTEGSTKRPTIVSVNPANGKTSTIINTYFGLPFNGLDDITWVCVNGKNYMFFTDPDYASVLSETGEPQLPNAVWRYDPQTSAIRPVISRGDILEPNGVRGNANNTKLYVTDSVPRSGSGSASQGLDGAGSNGTGQAAIYEYDLSKDGLPVNKRLFGIAREGVPDGIHVDDYGRVWTAEGEGIVVRNSDGKVLGLVNLVPSLPLHSIGNFAMAGDVLVVLDGTKLYIVKLAQTVVTPSRYHTA